MGTSQQERPSAPAQRSTRLLTARDACVAYVDSLGPDWCSLPSQRATTIQRTASNQPQRRPAVEPLDSLLPTVGPPEAAGWLLVRCAQQSGARDAPGVAEASEAVQPCPKGAHRLCTVSRHERLPARPTHAPPPPWPCRRSLSPGLLAPGRAGIVVGQSGEATQAQGP